MIGDPSVIQRWRRAVALLTLLLFASPASSARAQDTPAPGPLMLVTRDAKRPVPTTTTNGRELIALDDIATLFQVAVREDALAGGFTLSYRGRTIIVSGDQPMASVEGRVVSLPSPAVRSGRRWLVPVEFLPRALGLIYEQRIDLRRASRLLLVGDVRVPRISARIDAPGPPTRAAIVVTPASAATVTSENGRLVMRVEADALDPVLPLGGSGLIDSVRIGESLNTLVMTLSRLAAPARVTITMPDNTTRVAIEVPAAPAASESRTPNPETKPPNSESRIPGPDTPGLQTIVIDPGHGGEEVGVRGPGGLEEKQLTLDVARRLRSMLESRLGVRVILTRDDDRAVSVDDRAAAANNGKADLLVSLHANGSLSASPAGAEVFYERLDREGEAVRVSAATGAISLPVVGGGTRTIDVVPWDLAQARHIDASSMLARVVEEELRRAVPMSQRPLQQAPMRLLSAANMPAVLVEMAYLTNRDQEKLASGDEFRNSVAQALFNAIVRFRGYLEESPTP